MNSEQLHSVCKTLVNEISRYGLIENLETLESELELSANDPTNQDYQKTIGKLRSKLIQSLYLLGNKNWTVSEEQIISEIGGARFLGTPLRQNIERAFSQNQATPHLVKQSISELTEEFKDFLTGLNKLIDGFDQFDIGFDELEPNSGELGILIPRVNNESLAFIAKDLVNLERDIQAFSELVTGQTEQLKIRTISSSDYCVFLNILPTTLHEITLVIASLLVTYEKVLKIRQLRKQLKDTEVPDARLAQIDEHVEEVMENKIKEITNDLKDKFQDIGRADGRENELDSLVERSLKRLAKRIDNGYNFSARVGSLPDQNEQNELDEETLRQQELLQSVKDISKKLEHREFSGEPILPMEWLPRNNDDDNGDTPE